MIKQTELLRTNRRTRMIGLLRAEEATRGGWRRGGKRDGADGSIAERGKGLITVTHMLTPVHAVGSRESRVYIYTRVYIRVRSCARVMRFVNVR